jgi:hypothetical protein
LDVQCEQSLVSITLFFEEVVDVIAQIEGHCILSDMTVVSNISRKQSKLSSWSSDNKSCCVKANMCSSCRNKSATIIKANILHFIDKHQLYTFLCQFGDGN